MHGISCLILITTIACALLSTSADTSRKLLARDLVVPASDRCRNTVQGLSFISDDRGLRCPRDEVDFRSGCCTGGVKFSCDLCDLTDKCCSEYEGCVSCCMAPQHGAGALAKTSVRSPKHASAGNWADAFDYCRGTCRTHGKSTSHENAYIGARHHCFSKLGKPMLSKPLPDGALSGVQVVLGAPQKSCDAACAALKKTCSQPHLALLNSCDRLREVSACEAGCVAGLKSGAVPGYVETSAPKSQRPALCMYADEALGSSQSGGGGSNGTAGGPVVLKCGTDEAHFRRLCVCK